MAKKGDAHEYLSMLFQRDGVLTKVIVDVLKEQTLGVFKRKFAEAGCHLRHMEPESPWQMAEEGVICEQKIGSGRKMTKMKFPILSRNIGSECRPNINNWPTVPSKDQLLPMEGHRCVS